MRKDILVTGAGSGIGRAIAKTLANNDFDLVLVGRNRDALEQTKSTLKPSSNHRILIADIRDAHAIRQGLLEIKPSLFGVIANAGLGGENHYGDNDNWQNIIDTNLTGTYLLVQESLPYFLPKEQGFRHIIIMSSILARLGVPGYSAYCASKAGLLGLMRSWAAEYASQKILVNALCPGWVKTEMATQGLETFAEKSGKTYETIYQEQMDQVLLGKMSEPEEIAEFVNFLLSPLQTSITGQALDINNGAVMPA